MSVSKNNECESYPSKKNKVVVLNPYNLKIARNERAVILSTAKYWKLIFVLHFRHFPLKIIKDINGILSNQLIFDLQFKQ